MDRAKWGRAVIQCDESSPPCKLCLLALAPHIDDEGRVESEIDEVYEGADLDGVGRDDFRQLLESAQSIGWLDDSGARLEISTSDQHDT